MDGEGIGPGNDSRDVLKDWHRNHADEPIEGHDADGVWHESLFAPWYTDALPIVIDANVLRNCVGPTAKRGVRMALTSVANARGTRVYCAAHVISEFFKHLDEWADGYGVTSEAYLAAFEADYRPLLRLVHTDRIEEMLMPDERARLDLLRAKDADDIPTATLAIAMGAMPITVDTAPWEAVYGRPADRVHLRGWLDRFMTAGDRAEAEKLQTGVTATLGGALVATGYGAMRLFRFSPILFAAVAVGVSAFAVSVPRAAYARRWDDVTSIVSLLNEKIVTPHYEAELTLRAELPPFPEWEDLVGVVSRDAALGRACLYRMARTRNTPALASAIAEHLPQLAIGTTPQRIGTVLRRYPAFLEVAPKAWQVGRPIVRNSEEQNDA